MNLRIVIDAKYSHQDPSTQELVKRSLDHAIARGLLGNNPVKSLSVKITTSNPVVLKGTKLQCPNCKNSASHITRNESMMCNADIVITDSGNWDYSGETDAVWETQKYHPENGEPEWWCHECDTEFNAPDCHQESVEVPIEKPAPKKPEQPILPGIR
jgi:Zn finger protein HypA/HybF involved in hydrogenase expression